MIVAMPRLAPFGPYVRVTLLTGPTDLTKYSYIRKGVNRISPLVCRIVRIEARMDGDATMVKYKTLARA